MFRDERGEEVLRVVKKVHKWSGRVEYSGVVEGREVWGVRVHRGMRGVGYSKLIHGYTFTVYVYMYVYVYTSSKKKLTSSDLTIFPTPDEEDAILVENNVLGQEMGMLYRGNVVANMSMHEKWKHLRREDVLNVAAGMDVLLAVGMCFVRIDREEGDKAGATVANASAAGAVVTAVT